MKGSGADRAGGWSNSDHKDEWLDFQVRLGDGRPAQHRGNWQRFAARHSLVSASAGRLSWGKTGS